MKIGMLVCDGGDGYSNIHFYRNIETAENDIQEYEQYYCNEDVTEIEVPDDFVPPGGWDD